MPRARLTQSWMDKKAGKIFDYAKKECKGLCRATIILNESNEVLYYPAPPPGRKRITAYKGNADLASVMETVHYQLPEEELHPPTNGKG